MARRPTAITDVDAIAERLRVTRLALGMNQATFAKMVGLNSTAWNNYEVGERRISVDAASSVCRATGVTLDWIYLGSRGGLPFKLAAEIAAAERDVMQRDRVGRRA